MMAMYSKHVLRSSVKATAISLIHAFKIKPFLALKAVKPSYFDSLILSDIIPDCIEIDLDQQRHLDREDEGVLYQTIWSLAGRLPATCSKRVCYKVGTGGFTLEVDMNVAPECTYLFRDPTPALTQILRERPGRVMFDVGANVGFHALTASMFYDRVFAFEPVEPTFAKLQNNILLSDAPNIEAQRLGLSDQEGTALLNVDPVNSGASKIVAKGSSGSGTPIAVTTMDAFVEQQGITNIDFIKIDVEGHECEVIRGGLDTIARDKPILFVEILSKRSARQVFSLLHRSYQFLDPITRSPIAHNDVRSIVRARDVLLVPMKMRG